MPGPYQDLVTPLKPSFKPMKALLNNRSWICSWTSRICSWRSWTCRGGPGPVLEVLNVQKTSIRIFRREQALNNRRCNQRRTDLSDDTLLQLDD